MNEKKCMTDKLKLKWKQNIDFDDILDWNFIFCHKLYPIYSINIKFYEVRLIAEIYFLKCI